MVARRHTRLPCPKQQGFLPAYPLRAIAAAAGSPTVVCSCAAVLWTAVAERFPAWPDPTTAGVGLDRGPDRAESP
jgi:hypothetical protein